MIDSFYKTNFVCPLSPIEAYDLAFDQGPNVKTRAAACRDPYWAYLYACDVDWCARDDTRKAACQGSWTAYRYALYVDKGPRDDTRAAACQDPHWAYLYVFKVDLCLHPEAVQALPSVWLVDAREQIEFD